MQWLTTGAKSVVLLGLIGTMYGVMIATDIDPFALSDVGQVAPVVGEVLTGIRIAITTTLAATCVRLWLEVVLTILDGALTRAYTKLVAEMEHATIAQ